MRFVKLFLISVVFFCLLLIAISFLLPSQTNISRAIDINAPVTKVYPYVNNLENWKYWYADYDSSRAFISSAPTGKIRVLTVNKTNVTITETLPQKIKAVWQTGKSNPVSGEFNFIQKDPDASVTLQWNFVQKVKWYPWQKFASIVSGKIIGPFMEKSLENLKKEAEAPARKGGERSVSNKR